MSDKRVLHAAAKKQKELGQTNELHVLYALGRFGWLTYRQVSQMLWPTLSDDGERVRKVLARLVDDNQVSKTKLAASGNLSIKAYHLKLRGMNRLERHNMTSKFLSTKTKRSITSSMYQYHRLIANQSVIDVIHNQISRLPKHNREGNLFLCERDTDMKFSSLKDTFGCTPDSLVMHQQKQMMMIEVENSRRGAARHGSKFHAGNDNKHASNKMYAFVPTYVERLKLQGNYDGNYSAWGADGFFDDLIEVFVCTEPRNFRSVWRLIKKIAGKIGVKEGHIFYVVLREKRWIDPLAADNIDVYDHTDPIIISILADADPYDRSSSYRERKEQQQVISELSEVNIIDALKRVNAGEKIAEVARNSGVNVQFLYDKNNEYQVF